MRTKRYVVNNSPEGEALLKKHFFKAEIFSRAHRNQVISEAQESQCKQYFRLLYGYDPEYILIEYLPHFITVYCGPAPKEAGTPPGEQPRLL